jgi:hypothetical protein
MLCISLSKSILIDRIKRVANITSKIMTLNIPDLKYVLKLIHQLPEGQFYVLKQIALKLGIISCLSQEITHEQVTETVAAIDELTAVIWDFSDDMPGNSRHPFPDCCYLEMTNNSMQFSAGMGKRYRAGKEIPYWPSTANDKVNNFSFRLNHLNGFHRKNLSRQKCSRKRVIRCIR